MKRWTMYNYPYPKVGLLSKFGNLAKGFSFSSFLDGTQKTLGVINQAIPIVYQVKPMFKNARTMFKIADELIKPSSEEAVDEVVSTNSNNEVRSNKPVFYI